MAPVAIVVAVWVAIAAPLAVLVGRVIKRRGDAAEQRPSDESVGAGERR